MTQLKTVSKKFYNFLFPMDFVPKYGGDSLKKEGDNIPGGFGMEVHIRSSHPINSLHTSLNFDVTESSEDH